MPNRHLGIRYLRVPGCFLKLPGGGPVAAAPHAGLESCGTTPKFEVPALASFPSDSQVQVRYYLVQFETGSLISPRPGPNYLIVSFLCALLIPIRHETKQPRISMRLLRP